MLSAKLNVMKRPAKVVWYWRHPRSGLDGDEQGICVALSSQVLIVDVVPSKVNVSVAVSVAAEPISM